MQLYQFTLHDVGEDHSFLRRRRFCLTDHSYPNGFAVDSRGWLWTTAGDGIHVFA